MGNEISKNEFSGLRNLKFVFKKSKNRKRSNTENWSISDRKTGELAGGAQKNLSGGALAPD